MAVHPTLLDIIRARKLINTYLQPTPMFRSPGFSDLLGVDLFIKHENFQPIRSFKIRGGLYSVSLLDETQKSRGVVTASTGNHGQGIAYAASAMGVTAQVVVPHGTPKVKSEAIRHRGAELIIHGHTIADGFEKAKEISEVTGMVYIEDGEDFGLMAGAGTVGLEMIEALPEMDILVLPVGGGNLIAGAGVAVKHMNPSIRLIGVQAENAPAVYHSWQKGTLIATETCDTFAGGLATTYPGELAFDVLKDKVDEMCLVTEAEMQQAIPVILEQTGFIAEGAAAAGFALCMKQADQWRGLRVGVLFSGGNLEMERIKSVMSQA
jgi:threonine dehydratase